MKLWEKVFVLLAIISLTFSGVVGSGKVQAGQAHGKVNEIGGGVLGGIAGGIIGAQVGKGTGKVAAIIGGTLAGAALGSYVGGYMDRVDQEQMARTLETQPTGETTAWHNPDSGHEYQVTPVRTYKTAEGQYCREFTTQVKIGGKMEDAYGTACRMPDGSWQIQRRDPEVVVSEPSYTRDHSVQFQDRSRGQISSQYILVGPMPKGKIPRGHWPPPGLCRIWFPGYPPGQQPPPGNCAELSRQVPPGAWLISR